MSGLRAPLQRIGRELVSCGSRSFRATCSEDDKVDNVLTKRSMRMDVGKRSIDAQIMRIDRAQCSPLRLDRLVKVEHLMGELNGVFAQMAAPVEPSPLVEPPAPVAAEAAAKASEAPVAAKKSK